MPSTNGKLAGPLTATNGDSQSFIAQSLLDVTPATNVPANPALTAGAAPGNQPRWGSRYPKIAAPVVVPENKAQPSTNGKLAGPLTATNGDSQSFLAGDYVRFGQVTPATNVPANPALTAGAAPGNQPRWGSRYPVIPAAVAKPINWAIPSTNGKVAGPLTATNGDSQSFFAGDYVRFGQVTPATNVPANPALTAGAAPGNQPRWGSRYPKIIAPVAAPINWAVPSTNGSVAGPLTATNGDSQSFISQSYGQVTPATNVPENPALTAGAAPGNQPRWGSRYPVIPAAVAKPINWAVPSTNGKVAGPLTGTNGDSQSFLTIAPANRVTPDHPVFDPNTTAGAATPAEPRFGSAYRGYNAAQARATTLGGDAVRF